VGGERSECAVRARVVVQHGRHLPRGASAGHEHCRWRADGRRRGWGRGAAGGGGGLGCPGFGLFF
jgi:hypothetical protein